MTRSSRLLPLPAACVVAVLVVLASAMASVASPSPKARGAQPKAVPPARAHDYTATKGLSQPKYATFRHDVLLPMADGRSLYIEVVRPKAVSGRFPVILEASPYHGTVSDRDGTRILPGPRDPKTDAKLGLTGYFAPRGYAVVMVDLRGTGRSQGCLDHLGPKDASDLKIAIEWAARQPWSNGRVGMAGHSYVAATQALAAAQRPRGLVTIVPSAGLASMYDHQFQAGVPYFLQWAGPMESYLELSVLRSVPAIGTPDGGRVGGYGDNVGRDPQETGCGATTSALTAGESQLSGQYVDWHRKRDFSAGATDAPIPVFLIHGVNDNAARVPAMEWFSRRGPGRGDKLWLGQWDHGVGCCPNRRGEQWTAALHAWFDHHLAQRRVETGPPVEVFLADGTFAAAASGARTEIALPGTWPPPRAMVDLFPGSAERSLGEARPTAGSVSFAAAAGSGGGVSFTSEPTKSSTVFAGLPGLRLVASVTSPRVHLIATLYDVDERGQRRRLTQFAMNPELREGIDRLTPVVPGQRYVLRPPGFTMAHHLRAGHSLSLRISTTDADKVPTFANDPLITVFTGGEGTQLRLPVLRRPTLVRDEVPL